VSAQRTRRFNPAAAPRQGAACADRADLLKHVVAVARQTQAAQLRQRIFGLSVANCPASTRYRASTGAQRCWAHAAGQRRWAGCCSARLGWRPEQRL
jgi:hypothetical protein